MASLVTLLIFALIQWLLGQNEDKSMFLPSVLQQKGYFAVKPATSHLLHLCALHRGLDVGREHPSSLQPSAYRHY